MHCPKIELHVHLEGTVRPERLLEFGRRNGVELPVDTVEDLRALYRFRDFEHFLETWLLVTSTLRAADDFRAVVTDYAEEAKAQGAVFIEGAFSPTRQVRRGIPWEEIFAGYCEGAQEARELYGVEVRLAPDITRGATAEECKQVVRHSIAFSDRGIVAVGLGGYERQWPPDLYADFFQEAREAGLGSVPHAGEVMGPDSIRDALHLLHADRLRHGIRAVEDPELLAELAERGTVLDVCLVSNVCTGVVPSLAEHPLPQLVAAGVRCSLSTDDPAMFDTSLEREYAEAAGLGLDAKTFYDAGVAGAICDEETRKRLREIGDAYDWSADAASASSVATARS
jgi:aminodeoxyfutalosine deaminase